MQPLLAYGPWFVLIVVVWVGLMWLRSKGGIAPAKLNALRDAHGRLPAVLDPSDPTRPIPAEVREERDEPSGLTYSLRVAEPTPTSPPFIVLTLLAAAPGEFFLQTRRAGDRR